MVFSSIAFLLYFFPLFLFTYYLAGDKYKNAVILVFSLFFYSWGAPRFVFVLLLLTGIDFYVVRAMVQQTEINKRKLLLALSICINMGLLFYFKYSNFFIGNINAALGSIGVHQLNWVKVALPIGISFFTFETLTYSIDAYRGIIKPLKKLSDYYLYIFLFPKLIAGPIVRFNLIEDQIQQRHANDDAFILGFYRFVIGLSKKILIANTLGAEADRVFGLNALQLDSGQAWSGILAYTFQIYFDFSGYSDMALGIGRMIGFRFPENFDNPYNSASITEFWRRWHMTLGMWMREYLYIPLGGNKVSTARLYFNLWLVFLLSGLWHGASWNFVAWGAFHGTFLVLDRIFLLRVLERIGKIPAVIFTFFIVVNGWVLFRIEDFSKAGNFFKALYSFHFAPQARGLEGETVLAFVFATFFSFFCLTRWGKRVQDRMYDLKLENYRAVLQTSVAVVLFILCLSWITTTGFNPFIYYRF